MDGSGLDEALSAGRTQGPGGARDALQLPLVSVIVICYNHAPFVEKCLESVRTQTYPNLETIVVENLSTDHSRSVIEGYVAKGALQPLTPIYSTYNGREMGAMLQGFALAKGRYICFVDADDWLLPTCIETHIKAHLVSRVAIGVTSVDMYQSFGDDVVVGTGKRVSKFVISKRGLNPDLCRMANLAAFDFPTPPGGDDLKPEDMHFVPPSMGHEWHWSPTSGLCFRREIIDFLFTPPPPIRDGVDGYLVRGACCLTGGITIDKSLSVYRMHGNNLFATHPALENLLQFNSSHNSDLDLNICEAVLFCLEQNMRNLGQKLEVADAFIEAVHSMSRVALDRKAGRYSSFTARYLVEKRADLVACFGADAYRRWRWKYLRLADHAKTLAGAQAAPS